MENVAVDHSWLFRIICAMSRYKIDFQLELQKICRSPPQAVIYIIPATSGFYQYHNALVITNYSDRFTLRNAPNCGGVFS